MNFQKLSTSRWGTGLAFWIGRLFPVRLGYLLSEKFADILARDHSSALVRAVRANQAVVRGGNLPPEELDAAAAAVFRHAGRCFVDLFHNYRDPEKIKQLAPENPQTRRLIEASRKKEAGTFLAISHLSNFDLGFLSLGYHGLEAQVLTYSHPTGGYEIQNQMRRMTTTEVTPISEHALQHAIRRLKEGGVVITAMDRPVESGGQLLNFFGRPANLPTGPVRMALAADVPVVVGSVQMKADGTYCVYFSDPIQLEHHRDRHEAVRRNAETLLKVLEGLIRQTPDQWLMYYPVWPDNAAAG